MIVSPGCMAAARPCTVFSVGSPDGTITQAARLGGFHGAEGVRAARDRQVFAVVAGDLEEDAGVGTPLVGLAGGVEEAGTKAEAGGDPLPVADGVAHRLERRLMRLVHLHVGE